MIAAYSAEEVVLGRCIPNIEYLSREGAYALIFREGRLAVVRTIRGLFLPGGGIHQGETPEECLRRELLEETGHDVIALHYMCTVVDHHYSSFLKRHLKSVGYFFNVTLGPPVQLPIEPGHSLEWIDAGEAQKRMLLDFQKWAVTEAIRRGYSFAP